MVITWFSEDLQAESPSVEILALAGLLSLLTDFVVVSVAGLIELPLFPEFDRVSLVVEFFALFAVRIFRTINLTSWIRCTKAKIARKQMRETKE